MAIPSSLPLYIKRNLVSILALWIGNCSPCSSFLIPSFLLPTTHRNQLLVRDSPSNLMTRMNASLNHQDGTNASLNASTLNSAKRARVDDQVSVTPNPTPPTTTTNPTTTSPSASLSKPKPSFYKRQLPNTCTDFASQKGKKIFTSALLNSGCKSFFSLIQQFTTQSEPSYCGLTTLTLVLNALSVDPKQNWKGAWRWYSEEMLNCCVSLEDVQRTGITLQDFHCLAICQGLAVTLTYVDEPQPHHNENGDEKKDDVDKNATKTDITSNHLNQEEGIRKFRKAVQQACMETHDHINHHPNQNGIDTALVVSYSRKVLQQTGFGHFATIGAYDPISDQLLILDTARFKYGAHWTKLELLYEAMKPVDKATGRSRGYALLSFQQQQQKKKEEPAVVSLTSQVVQPISLLFASRLIQSPNRLKYKRYLQSIQPKEVSFDQVVQYWTTTTTTTATIQNETTTSETSRAPSSSSSSSPNGNSVWDILEPLPQPKEETQQRMLQKLHQTIQQLLQNYNYHSSSSSRTNRPDSTPSTPNHPTSQHNPNPTTGPHHALLVIFLASIHGTCRRRIVQNSNLVGDAWTKEQLLNEATLIASAIETSDQNDLCCTNRNCDKRHHIMTL